MDSQMFSQNVSFSAIIEIISEKLLFKELCEISFSSPIILCQNLTESAIELTTSIATISLPIDSKIVENVYIHFHNDNYCSHFINHLNFQSEIKMLSNFKWFLKESIEIKYMKKPVITFEFKINPNCLYHEVSNSLLQRVVNAS